MVVTVPDWLAARLRALAEARGATVDEVAALALNASPLLSELAPADTVDHAEDPLEAFFGCGDSGDPNWAGTDTRLLRNTAR